MVRTLALLWLIAALCGTLLGHGLRAEVFPIAIMLSIMTLVFSYAGCSG